MNYVESLRHLPPQTRMKLLYLHYVAQNPSLKEYVVLMGFTTHYRTDQELIDFMSRIMGKRSVLASLPPALAYIFHESVNYN